MIKIMAYVYTLCMCILALITDDEYRMGAYIIAFAVCLALLYIGNQLEELCKIQRANNKKE